MAGELGEFIRRELLEKLSRLGLPTRLGVEEGEIAAQREKLGSALHGTQHGRLHLCQPSLLPAKLKELTPTDQVGTRLTQAPAHGEHFGHEALSLVEAAIEDRSHRPHD